MSNLRFALQQAEVMIFDLDRTLYAGNSALFAEMEVKIRDYVARHLQLSLEKAEELRSYYVRQYGTTLAGLLTESSVDPHHFLEEVHELDHSFLQADPELDHLLSLHAKPKIVYTNGPLKHAQRTLESLGITHHFEQIFDIIAGDYQPKPQQVSYEKFLKATNVEPQKCIFFEDSLPNLLPAADLGMVTVWIEPNHIENRDPRIHYQTSNIKEALCF